MNEEREEQLRQALTFVLTFARPPDISLSSDAAAWEEFDQTVARRSRREQIRAMQRVAERLDLTTRVDAELERIVRRQAVDSTPEQRLIDLGEDVQRIFGPDDLEVRGGVNAEGEVVMTAGEFVYVRRGGPMSTFARHRRTGDRVEVTLWNRAGVKVDQGELDLPPDGGLFGR